MIDFAVLLPKLRAFGWSFAVIALYWVVHRTIFGVAVRDDGRVRLLNMLLLASVVFLPFPTSAIYEFPPTSSSVALYAGTVAAVGFLSTALAVAVNRPGLISESAELEPLRPYLARSVLTPLVFAVSIPVALVNPRWAMDVWILAIPGAVITGRAMRAARRRRAATKPTHGAS